MIDKICEICGSVFQVKPYRASTARFCSQSCGGKWHMKNRVMRGPSMKGNTFRKGKRPANAFTSEQVRGKNNSKWVEPIALNCEHCGKTFYVKPWIFRQNKSRFCGQSCASDHNSGPNHWGYLGGPMTYRGRNWRVQRDLAADRDNGTCVDCGKVVGRSIPVHHVKPFRNFETPEAANELSNLVCLCQSCHMKRESKLILASSFSSG